MVARIPEQHKQPGVCYAVSDDGLELPVIDITHPAFDCEVSEAELSALIDSMQRATAIPAETRQAGMLAGAQQSILMRGMAESAGGITTGMMTYLNKLKPEMLGEGYASPVDRQWAAGLTPLTFRWRMRDLAHLLADGLAAPLAARPGSPLHLINIAGGPAVDSLNALILLHKEQPALLAGRPITVHVLDIDPTGPHFGARALDALQADGGPLAGLGATFEHTPYDWNDPAVLRACLEAIGDMGVVMAGSSEGGLFEYPADDMIVANLDVLRDATPADFFMAGPVIRDATTLDPRLRATVGLPGQPAVRYLGLEKFGTLAARAGWTIARHLDGPMHQVVRLQKA